MNAFKNHRVAVLSALGILSLMVTAASYAPGMAQAIQTKTDVSVRLAADRNTVKAGQTVTYTVTMTNLGPAGAYFVDIALNIPNGLRMVSIACDKGISPDGHFCEYASLPAGATVVSTLVATPRTARPARGRVVTMSASVFFENAEAIDPNTGNNTAALKTRIVGRLSR